MIALVVGTYLHKMCVSNVINNKWLYILRPVMRSGRKCDIEISVTYLNKRPGRRAVMAAPYQGKYNSLCAVGTTLSALVLIK